MVTALMVLVFTIYPAGVWGNLAGVAPASAIFISVYEPVKKMVESSVSPDKVRTLKEAWANKRRAKWVGRAQGTGNHRQEDSGGAVMSGGRV
jgi:hypothetical protein